MSNALWLLLSLPTWFFGAALTPFSTGLFTLIPAIGAAGLLAGAVLGVIRRRRGLLLFLAPVLASEGLVAVAGLLRGKAGHSATLVTYAFLALELLACAFLIWRLKGARLPAAALTVFTLAYALEATFIATMSFSDSWV